MAPRANVSRRNVVDALRRLEDLSLILDWRSRPGTTPVGCAAAVAACRSRSMSVHLLLGAHSARRCCGCSRRRASTRVAIGRGIITSCRVLAELASPLQDADTSNSWLRAANVLPSRRPPGRGCAAGIGPRAPRYARNRCRARIDAKRDAPVVNVGVYRRHADHRRVGLERPAEMTVPSMSWCGAAAKRRELLDRSKISRRHDAIGCGLHRADVMNYRRR